MEVMWLVLPLALGIACLAVIVFAWALRTGQFEDLVTPACRVLLDETEVAPEPAGPSQEQAEDPPLRG